MKRSLVLAFVSVTVTIFGIAAYRLSIDALAMVIGIVLGISMMFPVIAIMAWLSRTSIERSTEHDSNLSQPSQPIIIMPSQPSGLIQPASGQPTHAQQFLPLPQQLQTQMAPPSQRDWVLRVYGEESVEEAISSNIDY